MRWFDQLRLRFRSVLRSKDADAELARELKFHFDQQCEENLAAGMPPDEARYAALRKIGGLTRIAEQCREQRGVRYIESTLQDLRYALRSLGKSPAFTLVAVLTLALGVGANVAIFSLIDSVLLSSLPVQDPERLVFVRTNTIKVGLFNVSTTILNRDLAAMRERSTEFTGIASNDRIERLSVGIHDRVEIARGDFVSGNYFETLGVPAQIGRAILPADDLRNGNAGEGWPAMISDEFWHRHFGASGNALGERITINTIPFVIVGVMPPGFHGLSIDEPTDVMIPSIVQKQVNASSMAARFPLPENSPGEIFARLRPQASRDRAAVELTGIFRSAELAVDHLTAAERDALSKRYIELANASSGSSFLRRRFAEPLRVLMGAVCLVMLIACANIAALLLARGSARQKETAIRLSLGCSRGRIVRQWLVESLLLSLLGCASGVVFAVFARQAVLRIGSGAREAMLGIHWDYRLLAFVASLCVLNAVLFGVLPALRFTKINANAALKSSAAMAQNGRLPFGRILVAAQLAVSLCLITGSALFLVTLRNLYDTNLGFNVGGLWMATIDPRLNGYDGEKSQEIYGKVLERLSALPQAKSATMMNNPLLSGRAHLANAKFPGYVPKSGEDLTHSWILNYSVGPAYFATLQMPMVAGRDFTASDSDGSAPVAIVNESLAKHYFGNDSPLGKIIVLGSVFRSQKENEKTAAQIVGVVQDAHYFDVHDEHQEAIFTPLFQMKIGPSETAQTLIVRTKGAAGPATADVREILRQVDPALTMFDVSTMATQLDNSLSQPRLMAILCSFFGALALALSAIGLYGVLAYGVARRTGEIGIRMALGADRKSIMKMIMGESAQALAAGVGCGLLLAWIAARMVHSMLYGLGANDPKIYVFSIGILAVAGLLATLVPVRRAVRIEPMIALRHD